MEEMVQYPYIEYLINKKIWRVHWHGRSEDGNSYTDCDDEESANLLVEGWYSNLEAYDEENQMTDVEADADTLKSAGWGTDEDYNGWDEERF